MTWAALCLAVALAARSAVEEPVAETRGLWVVRTGLVSPASVEEVVSSARSAGLNTLFVQVRGRGDAFYASDEVARSPLLSRQPASFDPLAQLLAAARARGLAVHAWINVLLTSHFQPLSEENVVVQHPEWVMAPRGLGLASGAQGLLGSVRRFAKAKQDAEGFYLSPSAVGAADHLEVVVRELVRRYALDGLHLDFIRYPSPDYDYSRAALEGFRRLQGNAAGASPEAQPTAWEGYRRDVLTNLAARLARVAREERRNLKISAAVIPDTATARAHRFQDWPQWLEIGILDAVCPMAYSTERRVFHEQIREARSHVGERQALWAGIGAYRLTVPEVIDRIRTARALGASGFVLFSHESFTREAFRELRERAGFDPPAALHAAGER